MNRNSSLAMAAALAALGFGLAAPPVQAADWPQWRGANRDGKAADFAAPASWPKELTQKWKVTVGRGDASPAVVGDKVYVFARDEGGELTLCLEAASGKELWRDKYDAQAASEPMGRHPGPRSSPAVAEGKVVTYGARGTLSCLDAASGKPVWRKDGASGALPRFFTACSPVIAEGLCIVQLGGEEKGGVTAFDLATGNEKWSWGEDGSAYSSPTTMTVAGVKMVVALTSKRVVGLGLADGKLLWDTAFAPQGRAYNAATPIAEGATVIFAGSGRGVRAVKIEKAGDGFAAKELWGNPENGPQFNTPILKGTQVYGLSQSGNLYCLEAQTGKTLWTAAWGARDFGSVLDAGPVLMALSTKAELAVFAPSETEFKTLAGYKVADSDIYAHPVVAGKGIFIKDQAALTLWAAE